MASYNIETYVWDDNAERWRFDGEISVDPRFIAYIDKESAGTSDRFGLMCEMKIAKYGYYYYYHINEDDADFLLDKM